MGVFLVNALYIVVFLASLYAVYRALSVRRKLVKALLILGSIIGFGLLSIAFILTQRKHRRIEVNYVGRYTLKDYPDCKKCLLNLNSNNEYQVLNNGVIEERGDWHLESGDDYFIVFLDHNNHRLGSGKFAYSESQNGFDKD